MCLDKCMDVNPSLWSQAEQLPALNMLYALPKHPILPPHLFLSPALPLLECHVVGIRFLRLLQQNTTKWALLHSLQAVGRLMLSREDLLQTLSLPCRFPLPLHTVFPLYVSVSKCPLFI